MSKKPLKGIALITGNRLERLAEKLAQVLSTPLSSTLAPEWIVVQSRGMERWLSMQLARHHGICANCRFPFPNYFVHEIFRLFLPDIREGSPFDRDIMAWKIMACLSVCLQKPGFEPLRNYLGEEEEELKRFQLSERIADLFDQYLLFRPEMILRWEQGDETHWQAMLWRELVKRTKGQHRAALGKALFGAIETGATDMGALPERVSVFGISALPRFHMQVLAAISNFTSVNLFLMNPCKEYWGDIVSDWELKHKSKGQLIPEHVSESLHLEKGNSLLASMGTLGRDFFDLIHEFCEEEAAFDEPGQETLLSCIQSDILNLHERSQANGKQILKTHDDSIQIHSCHSPMREIEVLHDFLLDMFEKDASLAPRDILVMAPDIETYAPYTQAIFDVPSGDEKKIPYSIADRSIQRESDLIETFLAVLDLHGSRYHASQVLKILESGAVLKKFGLMESDLDLIRKWVRETRINWGIDAVYRRQMALPGIRENTWMAGLERLLLGYAMKGMGDQLFEEILPYEDMEGAETLVLGKFVAFIDALFSVSQTLDAPRTLDQWASTLRELIERLFASDESTESVLSFLRFKLNDLANLSTEKGANFKDEVGFSVIKWLLGQSLNKEGYGYGFITGHVTFCSMLPMRSIPFKVICLVGMNYDAYPRESRHLGFDLMARNPRPGDRSRRHDDRYLFLEALLSARKRLYISYVGQNNRDNSPMPPSVLVSELLDYIVQGFERKDGKGTEHLLFKHRLQPFSPQYFKKGKKLFSYSQENGEVARCLLKTRKKPVPFISHGLSEPADDWKTIDVFDLIQFFSNPSRYLINRRLGLYLGEESRILDDEEPFEVKGLEKYLLESKLLEDRIAGRDLRKLQRIIKAAGQLPHGAMGECTYVKLRHGIEQFAGKARPYMQEKALDPLQIDLQIADFRLHGELKGIYPERMILFRYARAKPKDWLMTWIPHLALNAVTHAPYPRKSLFMGLAETSNQWVWAGWEYPQMDKSEAVLHRLMQTYWEGLTKPLHFFPDSSWEWAFRRLEKKQSKETALRHTRRIWQGSKYNRGESENLYHQMCFGTMDPLDHTFQETAETVFGPLMKHQKRIK